MKKPLLCLSILSALFLSFAPTTLAQPSTPAYRGAVAQATVDPFLDVGPLALGMSEDEAQDTLGVPETETEVELSPVSGLYIKRWLFPEKGIGVTLEGELPTGPFKVGTVMLEAPCGYKAGNGITIGMPKAEAKELLWKLRSDDVDWFPGDTDDKLGVLQTSTFTLLSIGCSDGIVTHIYLGPGPD